MGEKEPRGPRQSRAFQPLVLWRRGERGRGGGGGGEGLAGSSCNSRAKGERSRRPSLNSCVPGICGEGDLSRPSGCAPLRACQAPLKPRLPPPARHRTPAFLRAPHCQGVGPSGPSGAFLPRRRAEELALGLPGLLPAAPLREAGK